MRKVLICIGISVLFSASVHSQTVSTSGWRHFINSNTPRCMIADSPFIWVGTDGGLIKFDRRTETFEIFSTDNSGLPDNGIFKLMLDKQHSLWVSTYNGGIARLQSGVWTVFNQKNSPLPGFSGGIPACDSLGRVWIATVAGLLKYEGGTWTKYDMSNSPMCSPVIEALTADRKGNMWIGCSYKDTTRDRGFILKFDGTSKWEIHNDTLDGTFHGDTLFYSIIPGNPWSMLVDHNDDLFIGFDGLVNRYTFFQNKKQWLSYDITPNFNWAGTNHIVELAEISGYIWGADDVNAVRINDTLSRYEDVEQHRWLKDGSGFPFFGTCAVVSIDSELWFASNGGGGIGRFKDNVWKSFRNLANCSLSSNNIGSIIHDSKGRLWFLNQKFGNGGLSEYDGRTWHNYDTVLHGAQTMSLCADSSGNIWIGTVGAGLIKFDGVKVDTFNLNKLINFSNSISALAFDKQGILWIGTHLQNNTGLPSGLVKYDGKSWTTFTAANSILPEAEVSSIAIGGDSKVWAATPYAGVAMFDGNSSQVFNSKNSSIPSDGVLGIVEAQNGDIWITAGPSKWDGKTWSVAPSGSLSGLSLTGCAVDRRGHVWFSSYIGKPGGASEFDGTSWKNYTLSNSAIGSEVIWTVAADDSGGVWFGTADRGVVAYTPETLPTSVNSDNNLLSKVTDLSLFPNPFNSSTTITFTLSERGAVTLDVFDVLGRKVRTLAGGMMEIGPHSVEFDARNLAEGVYTAKLMMNGVEREVKMMVGR